MNAKENSHSSGQVHIQIWNEDGSLDQDVVSKNLIVDSGHVLEARWSYGDSTDAIGEIGIGDSSTAAAAGDTDLQASTNKLWKDMQSSNISRSDNVVTYTVPLTTSEGNFTIREVGLRSGTANTLYSRSVLGTAVTKSSSQTGTITYPVTYE